VQVKKHIWDDTPKNSRNLGDKKHCVMLMLWKWHYMFFIWVDSTTVLILHSDSFHTTWEPCYLLSDTLRGISVRISHKWI